MKIVTGQKGQIGSCGPRVTAGLSTGGRKALLLLPLHTFHPHVTGLPGFRVRAPIFSVGKIGENFFYIGNFKTIITLCVKNVQRNL